MSSQIRLDSDKPRNEAQLNAYENYWKYELPNSPTSGLVGMVITFFVFIAVFSLPWVVSFLQDNHIIHPHIHIRGMPEADEEHAQGQSELEPASSLPSTYVPAVSASEQTAENAQLEKRSADNGFGNPRPRK